VLNVLIERSPEDVWALLEDGHSYAEWVVGTQQIHEVDEHWPAVGSTIHFTAGVGPIRLSDTTIVRRVQPKRELELEAQAKWLGTARICFDLRPWGEHTLVIIDEHPLSGPSARWHNTLADVVLRWRNRRMVRALAAAVEKRNPR
jgi:uncharacterized protein YndB with AHSA1/START domain